MTDEQAKVEFLATKVCRLKVSALVGSSAKIDGDSPGDRDRVQWWKPFTSIVDAREVLRAVPEELRGAVIGYLESICVPGRFDYYSSSHVWAFLLAEPSVICEVVLRTYGYYNSEGKNA